MKKWAFIQVATFLTLLTWMLWPRFHTASALPETDLQVTFTIWPLFNGWRREVLIEYRGESIERRLSDDTGWWSGSSLYAHKQGAFVIHEGQYGCIAFTTEPMAFVSVPDGACTKRGLSDRDGQEISQYDDDLTFFGHFDKTNRDPEGVRLRFLGADEIAEVELPAAL